MFWTTKKKAPKKRRTIGQALQEDKVPVWQNKYILEIETEVHTPDLNRKDSIRNPSDTKTTLVYTYTIALYKQAQGNYLLLVDRVYMNKKDGSGLTVIEELSKVIGRHASCVIYEIDTTQLAPIAIYNYEDLLQLWEEDKKIIQEYYVGRPAQVLMETTDQKVSNQKEYTKTLYHSFPNGILVDTFCAHYKPVKIPYTITTAILPNDLISFPVEIHKKSNEEFMYTAYNERVLDGVMAKSIFQVKQALTDQQYYLNTGLQCNISLQPDDKSWDQGNWILDIDCKDVYHKRIHLKLTTL